MSIKRISIAAVLMLLLGALAGCTTVAPSAKSAAPAAASGTTAQPPTIELLEPVAGAKVPAGSLKVAVKVTNLEFVMPSNKKVAGQGHVHFTLDNEPLNMSAKPEYTFENVAPGEHRLKAELVQNDASSFDPPVEQEITFTAE